MAKRRRRKSAEPTLFDLPLHSAGEDPGVESGGVTASAAEASAVGARGAGQGPTILFDETESGADDDPQLDLIDLDATTAEVPGAEALPISPPSGERGATETIPTEDKAFLGDRLLGGLADLAAQLIALGVAIAATHSLGVTVADWRPFGVLALVFSFLYWVVPLAFWGHTPGMAWVGHVARSSSGEPLSFGQTLLRWLGAVFTLVLVGLPLLLALTGRSFTDRLSDSRTTAGPVNNAPSG